MREKIASISSKAKREYLALSTTMMCAMAGVAPASAAPDAKTLVGNLVGIVCDIFKYIGMLLLVWGVGQLVLAFKNEDADSKSKAMMLIVASIVLITLRTLVSALGLDITVAASKL